MNFWRSQRGAAAVEFALVLPVFLLILLCIIEFGRAYNVQISLTHAARESARTMAVTNDWTQAINAGRTAGSSLESGEMSFVALPVACQPRSTVTVTITYPLKTVTGIVDDMTLVGKAAMRCGG